MSSRRTCRIAFTALVVLSAALFALSATSLGTERSLPSIELTVYESE